MNNLKYTGFGNEPYLINFLNPMLFSRLNELLRCDFAISRHILSISSKDAIYRSCADTGGRLVSVRLVSVRLVSVRLVSAINHLKPVFKLFNFSDKTNDIFFSYTDFFIR